MIIRANDKSEKGCASFWGNLSKSELDTIMRVPEVSWVTVSLRITTTTVHSRVSQLSQVIIKLLVAKIIIKVLFLPVTPVTPPAQTKIHLTKS